MIATLDFLFTMTTRRNGISRHQRVESFRGEGPNWILIAGGALLSTLSIRFVYKLKQSIGLKPQSNSTANGTSDRGRSVGCCLHSNASPCERNNDCCFHCSPGTENGDRNHDTDEQVLVSASSLPLVTVPSPSYSKENGVMWRSSPDHLEVPVKPYHHHSTCSDSPCVSESGSDIFSKREVIQKLRQQLKRREDMIVEMQEQITELQNSLNAQMEHSSHLQTQQDATNRDLFESEREIQRLRKAIADHCVGHGGSNGWNGDTNGLMDSENSYESPEKGSKDGERIEMLRKEVGELKEVIDGKEYLLKNYKEQKMELTQKIKELQQRLDLQLPNIL